MYELIGSRLDAITPGKKEKIAHNPEVLVTSITDTGRFLGNFWGIMTSFANYPMLHCAGVQTYYQ